MTDTTPENAIAQARAALDRFDAKQALSLLKTLEDRDRGADYLACLIEAHSMAREFSLAEAVVAQAIGLYPDNIGVLQAAGIGAVHARDYALAEKRFLEATRVKPGYAPPYNNLGMVYEYLQREAQARDAYAQAIHLDPALAPAYKNLGRLAETAGNLEQARTLYEQAAARTGAAPEFAALLANLGRNYADVDPGPGTDVHPTELYISAQLADAAERHLPPDRKPAVLDLICGTGLMGARLWRKAALMIGVDPRVLMLAQAQAKNVYYDLKDQIPSDYLRGCKRGETDLIVSNGAFANVGDLLPVFLDLYAVLAPGGLLVMSFPTHQDSIGFHVEGGGSFSHDPAYVQQRADFEGMQLLERIDYTPATHPQVNRDYTLMVFAKPA